MRSRTLQAYSADGDLGHSSPFRREFRNEDRGLNVPCVRVAVVGHVEWVEFIRVPHIPKRGEIVHSERAWEEPGGGGAVAAAQLAKLAGGCSFFTALSDSDLGRRANGELQAMGLVVHAAFHNTFQRRAVTHVDSHGERTITVIGDRLNPSAADPLPWDELEDVDAVYFTGGDVAALQHARREGSGRLSPRSAAACGGEGSIGCRDRKWQR